MESFDMNQTGVGVMCGFHKYRIHSMSVVIVFCLIISVFAAWANREDEVNTRHELIEAVREHAQEYNIDLNGFDIKTREEGELMVVDLLPKKPPRQRGGSIELYFKRENGRYIFVEGIFGE